MKLIHRRAPFLLLAAAFTLTAPLAAQAKMADMKMIDPDSDGTVSLDEAKAAAEQKFAAMDPDKDGTIDKAEYMTLVEAAFKKADTDSDGMLDKKELATPAGKKLLALIQ